MSLNRQPGAEPAPGGKGAVPGDSRGALRVMNFEMPGGRRFERHEHSAHQLAWAAAGTLTVDIGAHSWVLPPTLALWIPAGTPHTTSATRPALMRSVYLLPRHSPVRRPGPTVVTVGPLLRELITHLADTPLEPGPRARAEALLPDLLRPVEVTTIEVPMPRDERALRVAEALVAHPADPRSLDEWGRLVGASARTLARLFSAETGLSFGRWRTRARLRAGLEHMAVNRPLTAVAHRVGYTSPSSFVAAFRHETGRTPGAYFSAGQGQGGGD
ncbi:transcriptional regulator [Streptomyces sp. SPB78]|uniref:AraC family transcriptional regulator n=1 Tax=Streptomyces sp. (strain SPB78) TaxID=591157 RepID=UPI0001B55F3C|nr:helix-turn-helix transcriptional regulator [Streptomyces sp. SPB78]EFL03850.1 transcriptional regulator [Streptomyces sp. SPB78]